MDLMMKWTLALALAAAPALANAEVESAQQPTAEMSARRAAYAAWQLSAVDALLDNGSADALFAAAMLLPWPSPHGNSEAATEARQKVSAERLAVLDRAARLESTAGDIAFVALRMCLGVDACKVPDYAERLHHAAPEDGMWQLPALREAREQGNTQQVSSILADMASAEHMGSWYGSSIQRIMRAFDGVPVPAVPNKLLVQENATLPGELDTKDVLSSVAVAITASWTLPPYGDLVKSCKPENPAFAARRDACRAIGMTLAKGSSIIDNMIGLALREMAAETEAQRALVKADKRQSLWILHTRTTIEPKNPRNFLQAVATYGSEMEASTALAAQAGLPTTPPPGWISRREKRDLLQDMGRQ